MKTIITLPISVRGEADLGASAFHIPLGRRQFFRSMAIASAGFTLPGYLAEALTIAPTVTEGPYYPLTRNIPLDKDNDLVQLNDNLTAASGIITYVSGRVLSSAGDPIRGALIELWHADREGDYLYSTSAIRNAACDANFAGFGQFLTGKDGRFSFRTVKAGLYNGRCRHYHWGVTLPGEKVRVTTQTGWNETALDLTGKTWSTQNSNDGVFSTVKNAAQRASMLPDFKSVSGTTTGEQQATWDYVAGRTFTEPTYPNGGSFITSGRAIEGGRFKITIPAYSGYSYEIYSNPTLADLAWSALPFSLIPTGVMDRHIHTATSDGALDIYLTQNSVKGFYYVSFRVPGANAGSPSGAGGGGPGGPGGPPPGG